jgi:hypothetical protein
MNEKSPRVNTTTAVWAAVAISLAEFLVLGFLAPWALDFSSGADLLAVMNGPGIITVAKVAAYIFPSAALLSGIPGA